MENIPDKINNTTTLDAPTEFNPLKNDIQNFITDTSQALGGDNFQLSKAASEYSARGDFYIDSGAANTYVLSVIGTMKSPVAYNNGMKFRFIPDFSNTGASTLNVAGLGVIPIKKINGSDLSAGDIQAGQEYQLTYSTSLVAAYISSSTVNTLQNIASNKNMFINPDFDEWQRAISGSVSGTAAIICDRFSGYAGDGGTATVSRQSFLVGEKLPGINGAVNSNNSYYYRHSQTIAATGPNTPFISQSIEDVRSSDNVTLTVSFFARLNSGISTITPEFNQEFGGGGSPVVQVVGTPITLTSSWARYTQTVQMPSISGKTIGTFSNFRVAFLFQISNTFEIDIVRVKCEEGEVATRFIVPNKTENLNQCRRFFYKTYTSNILPGNASAEGSLDATSVNNSQITVTFRYPVEMLKGPTVTFYAPISGTANSFWNYDSLTDNPAALTHNGQNSSSVNVSGIGTNNILIGGHIVSEAEY